MVISLRSGPDVVEKHGLEGITICVGMKIRNIEFSSALAVTSTPRRVAATQALKTWGHDPRAISTTA